MGHFCFGEIQGCSRWDFSLHVIITQNEKKKKMSEKSALDSCPVVKICCGKVSVVIRFGFAKS